MEITRNGSRPSAKGPEEYFTGTVRIDTPFATEAPARTGVAIVTFEPGARTAWHTHPLGQTLLVVSGLGWAQREGEERQEIRPGDVVWSRRAKSTGTAQLPRQLCLTLLSLRIWMARSSIGLRKFPTGSTSS